MNLVLLIGRAGRDPEVRYFESGTMVASLSLATDPYKKGDEPDWFNLEIWGKQAQVAVDYVKKGSQIAVKGSIHVQKWTDRTSGERRSKTVIRVDRLELLGNRRDSEGPAAGGATGPVDSPPNGDPADEEIPF